MTEYQRLVNQLQTLIAEGKQEVLTLKRQGKHEEAEQLEADIQLEIEMLKGKKLKAFIEEKKNAK